MAQISGMRGVVDYYVHMGMPCARSWPRSPGKHRAPAVEAQWPIFTYAAKTWGTLSPLVKESWNQMSVSTNMTGKDLFTKAFINKRKLEISDF